jgi:hypothetical protein
VDSGWVRFRREDFTGENLLFSLNATSQQEVEEFDLLPKHWKQELVRQARLAQPTLDAVSPVVLSSIRSGASARLSGWCWQQQ